MPVNTPPARVRRAGLAAAPAHHRLPGADRAVHRRARRALRHEPAGGVAPPVGAARAPGWSSGERQGQRVLYRLNRDVLLGALARFASEVDGPLRARARKADTQSARCDLAPPLAGRPARRRLRRARRTDESLVWSDRRRCARCSASEARWSRRRASRACARAARSSRGSRSCSCAATRRPTTAWSRTTARWCSRPTRVEGGSGLWRKIRIDPRRHPIIEWRWRVPRDSGRRAASGPSSASPPVRLSLALRRRRRRSSTSTTAPSCAWRRR